MGVFVRLPFFVAVMAAADWAVYRQPLRGCLVGAGMAILSWCLDAYLYFRQQRSFKPDMAEAVGESAEHPAVDAAGR